MDHHQNDDNGKIENAAAHKLPEYKDDDVPQMYQGVTAFLNRFTVS